MKKLLPLVLAVASAAPAASFTLEQVLGAPFPSDLVAAPGGGKVAWLLNEHGARNIWVASAPDFKGARLTTYTGDDSNSDGYHAPTPPTKEDPPVVTKEQPPPPPSASVPPARR